ncbi:MAG: large subunit ribosomal protein [Actinomycetota bacterium]|jgi:large subunit ribosomal protein L25|nr:large subunit ribosomal protein [Actinomycetota bacterium]
MAEIQLVAETGRPSGTRASKRLRREGKIPAVVYGHGSDPIAIAVDARDLRHALNTDAGVNALVNLSIEGNSLLTMARVLQRHPVRQTVTHVDFQIVNRDEVVTADVAISLVGEATDIHNNDGVVEQALFSLSVHAKPGAIPPHIEVDISALKIGDAIRVGDVQLPAGVTTEVDPEEAIVVGQGAQAEVLEEGAAAATAEGEQAEGEEGAPAAEGAAEPEAGAGGEGADTTEG